MMKSRTIFMVTMLSALVFTSPPALPDDPPPKGHGQNVKSLCKEAEAQYRDKSHRDVERIMNIYQVFSDITPVATEAEKKMMARTLKKAFDIKPFPQEAGFLMTAAACLSDLGKPGLDALLYALKQKNLKVRASADQIDAMQRRRVKETVIQAIGFNKNPAALKTLYKLLTEDDVMMVKAACRAISCFGDLPLEQRKPIVERLLKVYSHLDEEAVTHGSDSKQYDNLIIVEVAFNDALHKLTFRNFQTADEWKEWYKEYKDKKKW